MRIYVAGPLTQGDLWRNVERAQDAGAALLDAGHTPFIPHLFAYWSLHECTLHLGYEDWMALDFKWLAQCEGLLRLPGYSPGSDREVERARELGLPVFYSLEDLCERPYHTTARLPRTDADNSGNGQIP